MTSADNDAFPCTLIISLPFPSHRHADIAYRALSVDQELSPLVKRSFSVTSPPPPIPQSPETTSPSDDEFEHSVLEVVYRATTNRMLRVAVNGFFEIVAVVVQVMQELDVDVVDEPNAQSLKGVQGLEG